MTKHFGGISKKQIPGLFRKDRGNMNLQHETICIPEVLELVQGTDSIIFDAAAAGDVRIKGAADYVTAVDTGVQQYLQRELLKRYPQIGFIGEEQERFLPDPEKSYWILDPIDGTTNLIHHYGMSAVSLGLYEKGQMTFGLVYNPFYQERFLAVSGQGAWLNDKRICVSGTEDLSFALVAYGSSPYDKEYAEGLFALYEKIFLACADFRRSGSAALDLCYVACGRLDVYLERNLKPWDYAAGALILLEAGGKLSGWQEGETVKYLENADICATNEKLAESFQDIICAGIS